MLRVTLRGKGRVIISPYQMLKPLILSKVGLGRIITTHCTVYYSTVRYSELGSFINDKYAIGAGWDHMKYRTKHGSQAKFSQATVDPSVSSEYHGHIKDGDLVND